MWLVLRWCAKSFDVKAVTIVISPLLVIAGTELLRDDQHSQLSFLILVSFIARSWLLEVRDWLFLCSFLFDSSVTTLTPSSQDKASQKYLFACQRLVLLGSPGPAERTYLKTPFPLFFSLSAQTVNGVIGWNDLAVWVTDKLPFW